MATAAIRTFTTASHRVSTIRRTASIPPTNTPTATASVGIPKERSPAMSAIHDTSTVGAVELTQHTAVTSTMTIAALIQPAPVGSAPPSAATIPAISDNARTMRSLDRSEYFTAPGFHGRQRPGSVGRPVARRRGRSWMGFQQRPSRRRARSDHPHIVGPPPPGPTSTRPSWTRCRVTATIRRVADRSAGEDPRYRPAGRGPVDFARRRRAEPG